MSSRYGFDTSDRDERARQKPEPTRFEIERQKEALRREARKLYIQTVYDVFQDFATAKGISGKVFTEHTGRIRLGRYNTRGYASGGYNTVGWHHTGGPFIMFTYDDVTLTGLTVYGDHDDLDELRQVLAEQTGLPVK